MKSNLNLDSPIFLFPRESGFEVSDGVIAISFDTSFVQGYKNPAWSAFTQPVRQVAEKRSEEAHNKTMETKKGEDKMDPTLLLAQMAQDASRRSDEAIRAFHDSFAAFQREMIAFREEFRDLRKELREDIRQFREEVQKNVDQLREEIKRVETDLRGEIRDTRQTLQQWMTIGVAWLTLIVTILGLASIYR